MVSVPASLCGVLLAAFWSLRRGKDLDKDPVFQEKLKDPTFKEDLYGSGQTLIGKEFPASAYRPVWIFFTAIAVVVLVGAFERLRPAFPDAEGVMTPLSMNLTIQMVMLVAGAAMLVFCKIDNKQIANTAVFKAGMVAVFSVFGVAWMADTFFETHVDALETNLGHVVEAAPWAYAIVLFVVAKLVNSQGRPWWLLRRSGCVSDWPRGYHRFYWRSVWLLCASHLPIRSCVYWFRSDGDHTNRPFYHQPLVHHPGSHWRDNVLRGGQHPGPGVALESFGPAAAFTGAFVA